MQEWRVRSRTFDQVVVAVDQWAAWDTLRDRPAEDFGLVATASPDNDDDRAIPVQTATLMRRWGRLADACEFDDLARSMGLLT